MRRFWVGWYSKCQDSADFKKPLFQFWETGLRLSDGASPIVAVIDADSARQVWTAVNYSFPDFEKRFCLKRPADWRPPEGRFPSV